MIDDSCEAPREDLDDGFNPCRKQVVENGELEAYAHMYDVMNERYDREEDTSYLNSVKRDRITQSTPSQTVGEGKLYAQTGQGVEGFIKSSGTLDPTTHAEIPSSKAVADYVSSQIPDIPALEAEIEGKVDKVTEGYKVDTLYAASPSGRQFMKLISNSQSDVVVGGIGIPTTGAIADYAPIPLPISKGGTGGNTPYVTDDLDSSAIIVMHDAPNDRYVAAPMSSLTRYLDPRYILVEPNLIASGSDLNDYKTSGNYAVTTSAVVPSIINKPVNLTAAFNMYVFPVLLYNYYIGQQISAYDGTATYYRYYDSGSNQWSAWTLLYPTVPSPTSVDQGGTGAS